MDDNTKEISTSIFERSIEVEISIGIEEIRLYGTISIYGAVKIFGEIIAKQIAYDFFFMFAFYDDDDDIIAQTQNQGYSCATGWSSRVIKKEYFFNRYPFSVVEYLPKNISIKRIHIDIIKDDE